MPLSQAKAPPNNGFQPPRCMLPVAAKGTSPSAAVVSGWGDPHLREHAADSCREGNTVVEGR